MEVASVPVMPAEQLDGARWSGSGMVESDAPPLAGIRVLELAGIGGQYCGKLLGDMGADVIKIEPPAGDAARRVGPFAGDQPDPNRSLSFWYYNTSKRSITLDISH